MRVLTVAKLGDITSLTFADATRLVVWADKVVPRKAARTHWDVTAGQRCDDLELEDVLKGIRRRKLRFGDWDFSRSSGIERRLEACNLVTMRTISDEVDIPFRNLTLTPDGRALLFYFGRSFRNEPKGYGSRTWSDGAFGPGFSVTAYSEGDPHHHWFGGLAPLADNTRFVTIDYRTFELHPRLAVRSVASGEVLISTPIEVRETPTLVAAPGGEQLVAVSGTSLFVFDAADLTAHRRVRKDGRKHFTEVAFHPSGRYLAATSNDETVMLYDTASWDVIRTFTWEIGRMRSIAFSPDGTLAAAGSDKGKVVVWDVDV